MMATANPGMPAWNAEGIHVTAKQRKELVAGRRQGLGHLQQRQREKGGDDTHATE